MKEHRVRIGLDGEIQGLPSLKEVSEEQQQRILAQMETVDTLQTIQSENEEQMLAIYTYMIELNRVNGGKLFLELNGKKGQKALITRFFSQEETGTKQQENLAHHGVYLIVSRYGFHVISIPEHIYTDNTNETKKFQQLYKLLHVGPSIRIKTKTIEFYEDIQNPNKKKIKLYLEGSIQGKKYEYYGGDSTTVFPSGEIIGPIEDHSIHHLTSKDTQLVELCLNTLVQHLSLPTQEEHQSQTRITTNLDHATDQRQLILFSAMILPYLPPRQSRISSMVNKLRELFHSKKKKNE